MLSYILIYCIQWSAHDKNMLVLLLSGLKSTKRHKWHACHRVILLRVI